MGEVKKLKGFRQWDVIGISIVEDILEGGQMKTFEALQAEYRLHRSQYFKYIQLRHAWRAQNIEAVELEDFSPLEARLLEGRLDTKAVAMTYRTQINNAPDKLHKLRHKWERDATDIEDIDWEAALMHPRVAAIKSRLRLIQFKILHRC